MDTLRAALYYASRGWRVIPLHTPVETGGQAMECSCGDAECSSVGKHPRTATGLKEATTDPAAIKAWWAAWPDANIGIVTGAISGIYVIDLDGLEANTEISELVKRYGPTPRGPRVSTGGGGRHIIFAHPGGEMRNTAKRLAPHIDTRGDGGYIVAAPSLHSSGKRYTWQNDSYGLEVPPMPDWLIKKLAAPIVSAPAGAITFSGNTDDGYYWLGKALARASAGNRNDTGLWLATQLRDSGMALAQASEVMAQYAARVPGGDKPYREREAMATLQSAYSRAPRESARTQTVSQIIVKGLQPGGYDSDSPAGELAAYMGDIIDGKVFDAGWPYKKMTRMTNALLPGTVTMLVGDPGVGKTYLTLECLQYWHGNGMNPAALFVEKDRKFHTQRLLAQLAGNGNMTRDWWVRENAAAVHEAMRINGEYINEIGRCIHAFPSERLTLDSTLVWLKQQAEDGKRVIVIDPITAVSGGRDRFVADDDFMIAAQQVMTAYGCSLVLVTHSKKMSRKGNPTEHDMAFGAAYQRFSDTLIWLEKPAEPKPVEVRTGRGLLMEYKKVNAKIIFHLQKTRLGDGAGQRVAATFGDGGVLKFVEIGVIMRELKGDEIGGDEGDKYAE